MKINSQKLGIFIIDKNYKIMIKHIVCWKIKELAESMSKGEIISSMKEKLLALKQLVPVVQSLEVGINDPEIDKSNFDVVLITTFKSKVDLQTYQTHPEHVKVAEFVMKVRESRACVDFEY
jgi:hypothetical protein